MNMDSLLARRDLRALAQRLPPESALTAATNSVHISAALPGGTRTEITA